MSNPSSNRLVPVVTVHFGFAARLCALRSVGPVPKTTASSIHTAATGVTCGRPSGRTVDSQ
jgi:hypothetical protein